MTEIDTAVEWVEEQDNGMATPDEFIDEFNAELLAAATAKGPLMYSHIDELVYIEEDEGEERQNYVIEYVVGEERRSQSVHGTDIIGIDMPNADYVKVVDVDENGEEYNPIVVSQYNFASYKEGRD